MLFKPRLAILVSVMLWASAFPSIQYALHDFPPGELAALRFAAALIVLALYAVIARIELPHRRDWPAIAVAGALGIGVYHLALNSGQQTVTAGGASFIINTVPVWTALLALLLIRERPTARTIAAIFVCFCGVTLVAVGEGGRLTLSWGVLLILGAAISQAFYFVISKPLLGRYRPMQFTLWFVMAGTIFLLPFLPEAVRTASRAPIGATAAVLYLGVFPGAIGYATWAFGLSYLPVSHAASYVYLVPPFAVLISAAWLHEIPSVLALVGGVIAICGVALLNWKSQSDHSIAPAVRHEPNRT